LDDERGVEIVRDAIARVLIDEAIHLSLRSFTRSARRAGGFRLVRTSSYGPQTPLKSQNVQADQPRASLFGAAGRKPLSIASAIVRATSLALSRASGPSITGTFSKLPAVVQ